MAIDSHTDERQGMHIVKVARSSVPRAVAGAIAGQVREEGMAEVQAIGPYAVNQAIRAVAVARQYLAEEGVDIVCVSGFVEVIVDGEERTAMRLRVGPRGSVGMSGEMAGE
jgi:stage V sporulation protein S